MYVVLNFFHELNDKEFTYNDVYVLLLDNDASLPLIGTLDQLKSQISNFQDVLFFTLHNQNEPKIVATFAILSEYAQYLTI